MVFFDPRGIERSPKIEVVPSGSYIVTIEKTMVKEKDANSQLLTVFFNILKPQSALNKTIADFFNLKNNSTKAEEIGRQSFARLLDAIEMGKEPLTNESFIEKKVLKVIVGQEPHYKNAGQMQNFIVKYLPIDNAELDGVDMPVDLAYEVPFDVNAEPPF